MLGYRVCVDATSITINFEADDLEQSDSSSSFELLIGGLVRIAGTVDLIEGDVFIDPEAKPAAISVAKAQKFVVEAILRGQRLGIRRPLARRIRAALEN